MNSVDATESTMSGSSSQNTEMEQKRREAIKMKKQGYKAYKEGKYDEALELYDQAIQLDPSQAAFYNNKGGTQHWYLKFPILRRVFNGL